MYVVIMAGGVGTRFWPKSRRKMPKQFISVLDSDDSSLLQLTVKRVRPLVSMEKIFVVTHTSHKSEVLRQLPDIPSQNIIVEPFGRNTAPCIGLAAMHLRRIDSAGTMIVLAADHFIRDEEVFRAALRSAYAATVEKDCLMTLGIKPTHPETGYGYIHVGDQVETEADIRVYRVNKFIEKPDKRRAEKFLGSSEYLWNCGIFVWKAETILLQIKRFLPDIYAGLMEIDGVWDTSDFFTTLEQVYSQMSSISIDFGVMEKADDVVVTPSDPGWSDVGSWRALYDLTSADSSGNISSGKYLQIDSQNVLIHAKKKLVATIGVKDIIVVDTGDALLICHKDRAQEVKNLVTMIQSEGVDEVL